MAKEIPYGFIDRQGQVARAVSLGLDGIVVEAGWDSIEKVRGTYDLTAVHSQVEGARAAGLFVTLRITAGATAPAWLKSLGQLTLKNYTSADAPPTFTVPKWWEPQVLDAYKALQTVMAAEFDADPVVRQVQCCMVMLIYPETTVRWPGSGNDKVMLTGGLTWAKDQAALVAQATAMMPWQNTWVAFACNPVEYIDPTLHGRSAAELGKLIDQWVVILPRIVLQNHGLGRDVTGERLVMYQNFKAQQVAHPQRVAVTFQTQTMARLDAAPAISLDSCIADAGKYNGSAVELPVGYQDRITKAALDGAQANLFRPPLPPPPPPPDDTKAVARAYVEGAFFGDGSPRDGTTGNYTMNLPDTAGLKAIKDFAKVAGIPYTVTSADGLAIAAKNFPPNFLPANATPITTPRQAGAFIAGFIPGEGSASGHYVGDDPDPDHQKIVIDACKLIGVDVVAQRQKMVMTKPSQLNDAYKAGLMPVKTWRRWPSPPHP